MRHPPPALPSRPCCDLGGGASLGKDGESFGSGVSDSGLGRRHGADGILKYTEPQTVAHQRLQGFSPPRGVAPDAWARLLTRLLTALRVVGMR